MARYKNVDVPNDGEQRLTCPYEASHYIIHNRFATHIVKCKRQHPDKEFLFCIHNSTHIIPKAEHQHHISNCPDRRITDNFVFQSQDNFQAGLAAFPVLTPTANFNADWEDDAVPYNPGQVNEGKPLLQQLNVASSAVRKQFRFEQRQKHLELQKYEPKQKNTASSQNFSDQTSEAIESDAAEAMSKVSLSEESLDQGTKMSTPNSIQSPISEADFPSLGATKKQPGMSRSTNSETSWAARARRGRK